MSENQEPQLKELEESKALPSLQEQQDFISLVKQILNPNGEDPRIDEYITSTFSYISNVLYKMVTTDDKEATAKEIAQDLNDKFDRWVEQRTKQEQENEQIEQIEQNEQNEQQNEQNQQQKEQEN